MAFPAPPNVHAAAVLGLTLLALFLFTRKRVPLETSSLLVLVALAAGFELFPFSSGGKTARAVDFFLGFGHEALVAVCGLMVAGQGLVRTGALEPVGRVLGRLWQVSPSLSLLLTLIVSAAISAFINNVPIVVLLLPILISVSLRTKTQASAILMPMGFATLLGGSCTSVGTSTNLLVVSVAADMGLRRMGMFDFLGPAAIASSVGILYLWLVAPRIAPKRVLPLADTSPRVFTAHLAIRSGGRSEGKRIKDAVALTGGSMKVKGVERGPNTFVTPLPDVILKAGDHLVIQDTPDRLKEYEQVLEGALYPEGSEDEPVDKDHPLRADDQQIAEVVVVEGSPFEGTTLSRIRFADRYRLITLALHRAGKALDPVRGEVGDVTLQAGDVLLIQGHRDTITNFKQAREVLVLDATADLPFTRRAPRALVIMAGIILMAALGIMPIAVSAMCGVVLMIWTRCMSWLDATRALSTQVILIVVASLALGMALLKTGGADYLAQLFLTATGDASPRVMLGGLMLLMAVLTNIVSNNAAAVIGTPIAVSVAGQMGVDPEPFVLAVLFGANMSYATPMAYKTNLLVMNAGGYTFLDFTRVGLPLLVLMWLTLSWVLPLFYTVN